VKASRTSTPGQALLRPSGPTGKETLAMPDRLASLVSAAQRELLRQALADAVYYRDPPVHCSVCDAVDGLCDACAAGLARARAYLDLGRALGMEAPA
jgi:hypothetical protein